MDEKTRVQAHLQRLEARRKARQAAGAAAAQAKKDVKTEKVIITQMCELDGKILQPGQELEVPQWFAKRMYRAERARPVPEPASTKAAPAAMPVKKEANDG